MRLIVFSVCLLSSLVCLSENFVSVKNSTGTLLGADETFTGQWEDVSDFDSVMSAVLADQDGTLFMEFSYDCQGDADSSLQYDVTANVNEVHRLSITRKCYRTRYVNGSVAQGSFHVQINIGDHQALTAPANLSLQQDADAVVVRVQSEPLEVARGQRQGYSLVEKFGRNPDIDTGVSEDIWSGGGLYTFPTAAETLDVVSADAGDDSDFQVKIFGHDANYNLIDETVTLNGTTPVTTTQSFLRAHRAIVVASGTSNTEFNAGDITIEQSTSGTVVSHIPAGTNQSRQSNYTIPAGFTGYLQDINVTLNPKTTGTATGSIYEKIESGTPRLVRTFSVSDGQKFQEVYYGGLIFPEKTDFVIRIEEVSANNSSLTTNWDLILVKNNL